MKPITRVIPMLLAMLLCAQLSAEPAVDAAKDPFGKYFMVLKDDEPAPSADGAPRKKYKEPDLAKWGGSVLKRDQKTSLVRIPRAAAPLLCADDNVAYLLRAWEGESAEEWKAETTCEPSKRSLVQTDDVPTLTWTTGDYAYDGSGNIKAVGANAYTYDPAGRLTSATVNGTTETYKYDSFGNLLERSATGSPTVYNRTDSSSNRLTGETYDAGGSVLTRKGAYQYYYDSVGMITMVRPPFQTGRRMLYSADDERVGELKENTQSLWQFRDLEGHVLREFRSDTTGWLWSQDYVYAEGKLVAGERVAYLGGIRHYHLDHLGSVRVVTNSAGLRYGLHDYYPFGLEQTATLQEKDNFGADRVDPMKFAGHERDFHGLVNVENTDYLDYMHARYYDPNHGRFLSVDPGKDWDPQRPQSWNLYAYVRNNPIKNTDPTGRCSVTSSVFMPCVQLMMKVAGAALRAAENSAMVNIGMGAATGDRDRMYVGYGQLFHGGMTLSMAGMHGASESRTVNTALQGEAWMTPEAFGAEIGSRVAGQARGKMATIASDISVAELSQTDAATAVNSAVEAMGLRTTGVMKVGNDLVVGSVSPGANRPVLVINGNGAVSQASATIEVNTFDVVIKDIDYD